MVVREINSRTKNKNQNRGRILQLIATGSCNTKTELSEITGLSKMGISKIVSELINLNLLQETDYIESNDSGRKPIGLDISYNSPKILGIMIERGECDFVVTDLKLRIYHNIKILMDSDMNAQKLIQLLYQQIDKILSVFPKIVAIGLASIGPIDSQKGLILSPFYFYDIQNIPIVELLTKKYRLPVYFDHDNQSAMLAEALYGHAKNKYDVLYIGIGVGVGSGVLINGDLYSNHRNLPPEFGHVSINDKGKACRCGNHGCIESYIRTPQILKDLEKIMKRPVQKNDLKKLIQKEEVDLYFKDLMEKLALAIVSFVNIMNSQLIILGRDALYWPDQCLYYLQENVNQLRFAKWDKEVIITNSYFDRETPVIGAACNVIAAVFDGNLLFDNNI